MKCHLCELETDDADDVCRFHVGRCTHDREKLYDEWRQMAMDGHGVPDEEYQARMIAHAYNWSCCGGGGQAGEDGEPPRLHEGGCQQAPAHLTEGRIRCVFDRKHEAFVSAAAGDLAAKGLRLDLAEIDSFAAVRDRAGSCREEMHGASALCGSVGLSGDGAGDGVPVEPVMTDYHEP